MTSMVNGLSPADVEGTVVVGDDGSTHAAVAVSWAGEEAARWGVPLVVLRAWSLTSAPRPRGAEPGYVPSEDEFEGAVRDELAADVTATLGGEPPIEVRLLPIHAPAHEVLVAASEVAALVVVAARGKGLAKALLGSTTDQLVRRARGPVAVIPGAPGKRPSNRPG